jgi:hypothetical protein
MDILEYKLEQIEHLTCGKSYGITDGQKKLDFEKSFEVN